MNSLNIGDAVNVTGIHEFVGEVVDSASHGGWFHLSSDEHGYIVKPTDGTVMSHARFVGTGTHWVSFDSLQRRHKHIEVNLDEDLFIL